MKNVWLADLTGLLEKHVNRDWSGLTPDAATYMLSEEYSMREDLVKARKGHEIRAALAKVAQEYRKNSMVVK